MRLHLVRRALTSLVNTGPRAGETGLVAGILSDREMDLWSRMDGRDRRHSLVVLARFLALCPTASRAEQAAALLHDVGKNVSRLGWLSRVIATLVGPRGQRFRAYHDHERLGAEMLAGVSDERTVRLVSGNAADAVARLLRQADDT